MTFVIDGDRMAFAKAHITEPPYAAAKVAAVKAGDRHLADGPLTVMHKNQIPPSGSKHDFLSYSNYWWPNPNTADGFPYVYRDGQINPEYATVTDQAELRKLVLAVGDLTAAYYFTDDLKYSLKAKQMVRMWFIASATQMWPNFKYAGIIKGVNLPNHNGIISASDLFKIVDAVKILQPSPSWTDGDQTGFLNWCTKLFAWLTTSAVGIKEAKQTTNHGTYIHLQRAALAEFVGNHAGAAAAVNKVKELIDAQIRPDGYQPLEMVRTRPWNYATMNLTGLCAMARIGELEGIDLWNYVAPDGSSIRQAINFLRPYVDRSPVWPYPDRDAFRPWLMVVPLRQAATAYGDPTYTTDANRSLSPTGWPDYTALLY